MSDAKGVVSSLDGDYAIVQMDEAGGCGRCHEEGGCGGNNLGKLLCRTPTTFRVLNPGNASVGDHVTVSIEDGVIGHSALLAYGMPLLLLFAGAFAGLFMAGEPGAICGSIAGLCVAWFVLRYLQRHGTPGPRSQPTIKS